MRKVRLSFLLLCIQLPAHAQIPAACEGAANTLKTWLQALRHHQLDNIRRLLDPALVMKVEWLESTPSKFFSFSREDYLQQLKATWHFSRDEKVDTSTVQWQAAEAMCEARFTLTEKRELLGTAVGQESQLLLRLENTNSRWRISHLQARTRTW